MTCGVAGVRRGAGLFFCLAGVVWLSACGPEPAPNQPSAAERKRAVQAAAAQQQELAAIVAAYRKTIVLMTDEKTLPAADRPYAFVAGKLLFEGNVPRLRELEDRLERDLDAAAGGNFRNPLTLTQAFLDELENEPAWHDGDKLVFRDVVDAIADHLHTLAPASPAGRALAMRVEEDRRALGAIEALYEKELEHIFAQFRTRGMAVRREAWETFVGQLRTLYNARAIMDEFQREMTPMAPPAAAERPVSGSALPDKTLVLTFDDGPNARFTPEVLEVLDRFKVKSIFFEVGECVGRVDDKGQLRRTRAADQCQRIRDAGHIVGNHTNTHPFLPKLTVARVDEELDTTSHLLRASDDDTPQLFRPPYGAVNDAVRAEVAARHMRLVLWNIDSQDWADPVPTSIANRVIAEARERGHGIILFHDIHKRTVEALPLVLETLQAEGFRFVLWDGQQVLERGTEPVIDTRTPIAAPAAAAMPQPAAPLYNQSHAVIIGIDEYLHWPKLKYATADALAMRDILVNTYGFRAENVTVLLDADATRERILSVLGDVLANPKAVAREDRVLVFFAGHGATRALPSGRSLGYIVPVDADTQNFQGQCISMTNFQDIDESIPAKHVLYIMDACYGGLALTRGGSAAGLDPRRYIAEVTRRAVRQMVTAGGPEETVADGGPGGHSIFTWTLVEGLRGKADLNGDGYITTSELFAFAGPVVSQLSHQTPAFGNLVGSEGGEFVFELPHQGEDLSGLSRQLDDEAIRVNGELERVRQEIASKRARNDALQKELAVAEAELRKMGGAPVPATTGGSARALTDKGLAFYREKKYAEALEAFQAALRIQPSNAQLVNNIGFVFYRQGDFGQALEWYRKALALDPRRAIAYANAGEALEKLGRPQDAALDYAKFLELAPKHASAAYVRSRLTQIKGAS